MKVTSVFGRNITAYNAGFRIISNQGSTRSSKTWSIMQLLYMIALESDKPLLISIVSESMPHLKRGCIRDFQNMLLQENAWVDKNWNATDKLYKVNKSVIEFFSADAPAKVHGPARDILFVNECNNIGYETIRQLMIRTRGQVFFDYNPVEEFWMEERILSRSEGVEFIHSTYKDNEYLSKEQVEEIEANKHDTNWWNVYGLGLTGSREGRCIKDWSQVDVMPDNFKRRWLGLDFGFTNDPTSIIDVRLAEGELWLDEIEYRTGLTNPNIADILKRNKLHMIETVADSAEPKSIEELHQLGIKIEGAIKGPDSINNGLDILNRYKINVTKRSLNLIKELRNYKYKQDKDGNYMNEPIDMFNHAIDSVRYVALNKLKIARRGILIR